MDWTADLIEKQKEMSKDYREIALLEAVSQYIQEQDQRIESLNGQLEGKMWSPSNW
ncbi:hypothetical protein KG090_03910 [Carnobacteriaceae bacterium zg-ZUI240]|nr:hypothetical protein [Carnobacteriaceae bacterium zg-ZUI240]